MPFDVTMPDGTTITGVPDGTTKSQIMAKFQKASGGAPAAVASPESPAKAPIAAAPQAPQDDSFVGNVARDLGKRFDQSKQNFEASKKSLNPIANVLGAAAPVFGAGGDVIAEGMKSGYKAIPDVGGFKEKISGGIDRLMSSDMGKLAIEAAKKGGLAYMDFAEKHPDGARIAESLVDIGSFFPLRAAAGKVGTGIKEAATLASKPIPAVGDIVKGVRAPSVQSLKAEAAAGTKGAVGTIEAAKNSGAVFHPAVGTGLSRNLDTVLDMNNPVKMNASKGAADSINRIKEVMQSGNTSLDNLIIERNRLTEAIGSDSEPAAARKARAFLDSAIKEADKNKQIVAGDVDAVKNYEKGMKDFADAKQYEDLTDALSKGRGSVNKIRNQMNKLIDGGKINYYPEDIQKMIRDVAKGTTSENILLGVDKLSRSLPFVGQFAGLVVGSAANKGAANIAKGRVVDILNAIKESK